jgi:uncharacterized protein (TIGR02246 family)
MALLIPCSVLLNAEESANPDKAAVEKAIASYVTAFNKGDAEALSAHWSEQGEFLTSSGEKWQGHKQLAEKFTAYFAGAKDAKLELAGTQVELQSPSVAVETGIARVLVPDQEPEETEYKAIHIKTAAGWKLDSVRETEVQPPPPSHYEELQDLAWMVGEWADTSDNVDIRSSCRWTSNQNFLMQTFKVYVEGRVDFEGTQIIGWDPHAQAIRSWTFDSDGGFGAGRWTGGEGRWSVQTLNVLPDGRRGSATNIYEVVDDKTVRYRSIGRQVDGELMPSVGPVTIERVVQE